MKYRVMSVALAVSLALCPQPVFAAKAGNGGLPPPGWLRRELAERLPRTQPVPARQALAPLAVVGKIGADITQQQARG